MHVFRAAADGINTNLLILLHGLGVSSIMSAPSKKEYKASSLSLSSPPTACSPSPAQSNPIFQDTPAPYDSLASRMALPQTASLSLAGPIVVPETGGGRAWFQAFDDNFELIKV